MKRIVALLLSAVLLFTLTACDLKDILSLLDRGEPGPKETQPPVPVTPTAAAPLATEGIAGNDPALYAAVLEGVAKEFEGLADGCEYLLYDMDGDGHPELILKAGTCEADFEYRFYTQENGQIRYLGCVCGSHSGLCGYNCGEGLIIHAAHQMCEWITLVTLKNGSLEVTEILARPVEIYHSFTSLTACSLQDRDGLIWNRNPKDDNWSRLQQVMEEERLYQANMVPHFTREQHHAVNVFLSNFSEQRFREYPSNYGDLLYFVLTYCMLNKPEAVSYGDPYAVIHIDEANHVLKRYFDVYYYPNVSQERLSDSYGQEVIYKDKYLYFIYGFGEFCGYVTIVDQMTQNSDGTYSVHFVIFAIDEYNYIIDSYDKYYSMDLAEAMSRPEMERVAEGEALLKDYFYPGGYHSYQLLRYLEK